MEYDSKSGYGQQCESIDGANKYHDFECCEWTRGVDTLLDRFINDQTQVTTLIETNPDKLITDIWKQEGPLAIDNNCRCQMGKGDRRSPYTCAQCKNLRRLIDFRYGGVDRPFRIECGEAIGKNFIVTSTNISNPFLNWDPDSARRARHYLQQYQNLTICGTPNIENMRCLTGDSFTISTLIQWMISKQFSNKNIPHCPINYTSFICNGVGYSLSIVPDIGTINDLHKIEGYHERSMDSMRSQHIAYSSLKNSVTRSIIIQLLVILKELSSISFSHGNPGIQSLIFTRDPISYSYDNIHVHGPLTLKISNFSNSSATFGQDHYFPKNIKTSMYIERNMFIPEIVTKNVSMAYCQKNIDNVCKNDNVAVYRLTNSTIDIYDAMRHIGFPLYSGSFDFYCFMVALMSDKSFFDSVLKDPKLYRIWSMMWLSEDISAVETEIQNIHNLEQQGQTSTLPQNTNIINVIRSKWLRCDIVNYIWSLVKLGW